MATFGVFLFPHVAPYSRVRDLAQQAETLGFDDAWVADQTPMSSPDVIRLEAWTLLAALARDTTRIRLGTLVTSAPFRHPLILAMAVLTLDHASEGRVTLGIGAGGLPEDLAGVGLADLPAGELVARLAEQLDVVDRLLRGETVSKSDGYYPTADARVERPVEQPRPPIVVAAQGPRTIALAARYGEAWSSLGGQPLFGDRLDDRGALDKARRHLDLLAEACIVVGRDPATIRRSVMTWRTHAYASLAAMVHGWGPIASSASTTSSSTGSAIRIATRSPIDSRPRRCPACSRTDADQARLLLAWGRGDRTACHLDRLSSPFSSTSVKERR